MKNEYLVARMQLELEKIMLLKQPTYEQCLDLLGDLIVEYPDISDDKLFLKFRLLLRRGKHKYSEDIKARAGRKSSFELGKVGT